jgi:hypothetical protein
VGESDLHFTYASGAKDLAQGDLILKTRAVRSLIDRIHPHYAKDDYTHLLVLTQSCDLVRREGKACKARYITLAAVRPLRLVIEREVAAHQDDFAAYAGVCPKRVQGRIEDFLERLFNNNVDEYFFLHEDLQVGFSESSCAFLRLSVPVRAAEHYDDLMAERVLSLTDVFQAKLGSMLGRMYARVGTPDWVPDHTSDGDFRALLQKALLREVRFVEDEQLRLAKKSAPIVLSREATQQHIDQTQVPKKKERILDAVLSIVTSACDLSPDQAKKVRLLLNNDPALSPLLK